jgi:uncharacterized membrane protein
MIGVDLIHVPYRTNYLPAVISGQVQVAFSAVATRHMMIMATAWFCFLLAMMLSMSVTLDRATAQLAEVAAAGAGFLLMSAGGWFGGRLVYEFGIAVKSRANPDRAKN